MVWGKSENSFFRVDEVLLLRKYATNGSNRDRISDTEAACVQFEKMPYEEMTS